MEIWKEVKGFEGFYEVSNLGNVRSFRLFKHDYRTYRLSDEIVFECLKRIKKNAKEMGAEF